MENQYLDKYNLLDPNYGKKQNKSIKICKIEQPPKLETRIAAYIPKKIYSLIIKLKNFKYIGCVQALEIFEDENFLTFIYPNVLPYSLTQEKLQLLNENEKLLITIQLIIAYQEMQNRGYGWVVTNLSQFYFYDNLLQYSLIDSETFIEKNGENANQIELRFKNFLQSYFSDVIKNLEVKLLPQLLKQLLDKLHNFEDEEEFFRKIIMKKQSEIIYKGNSFIRSYISENQLLNKVMFPNWPTKLIQKAPIIYQKNEEELILKNIERELELYEKFNFQNQMVQLLAYFRLNKQIIFVMKKYDGSIDQLIEQWEKQQQIVKYTIYQVCLEVCSAIAKLHGNGVIHRDIKPQNFLYEKLENDQYNIYLADFDRSKNYQNGENITRYNAYLTPLYDPPENEGKQTLSYDIWQVGLVLLKIASKNAFKWVKGARYLDENEFNEAFNPNKIKQNLEKFDQKFIDLIIGCLQKKPENRSTSQQITDKMREIVKANQPKIKIIKKEIMNSS